VPCIAQPSVPAQPLSQAQLDRLQLPPAILAAFNKRLAFRSASAVLAGAPDRATCCAEQATSSAFLQLCLSYSAKEVAAVDLPLRAAFAQRRLSNGPGDQQARALAAGISALFARRGELDAAAALLCDCISLSRLQAREHASVGQAVDLLLLNAHLARLCAVKGALRDSAAAWTEALEWTAAAQLGDAEPASLALRREASSSLELISLATGDLPERSG
jgi:hypothetical protein